MDSRRTPEHSDALALSMHQAAKVIGISERTLHTLIKRDDVPHIRIGRRVLFRRESLDAWLLARETGS